MDASDKPMSYQGPLGLPHAHTKLNHVVKSEEAFTNFTATLLVGVLASMASTLNSVSAHVPLKERPGPLLD